jgi:hypothetical protein
MAFNYSYHHHRQRRTTTLTTPSTPDTMFGPPFPLPYNRCYMRHPPHYPDWDPSHYYDSGGSRTPSTEDLSSPSLTPYTQPYPFTHPNPHVPSSSPTDLPSRIAALNRRAAIVSANLAHLTAVVKPLESTKPENLSKGHLHDLHQEGVGLVEAMGAFEEQMEEVLVVLAGLVGERKSSRKGVEGEWAFERSRKRVF